MVKVSGVGLLALWKEKKVRMFRHHHSELATQTPPWPTGEAPLIIQNMLFGGFLFRCGLCHVCTAPMHIRMKVKPTHQVLFFSRYDIEPEPKWGMHVELSRHDRSWEYMLKL